VLVVDDDAHVRTALVRMLETLGVTATTVPTGLDALEALRLSPRAFDLVLLDVDMPGASGVQVLEHVKTTPELSDIPVVMVSGQGELDNVVRCLELGADDFVSKPFLSPLLEARVHSSLARKRVHDWEQHYRKLLEDEEARSEQLIANVLPDRIAARLKNGERQIAEQVDDLSVLFADLVAFTPLAAEQSPHEVVALLNRIFSHIDQLAGARALEKIKTIGDAYMVVGGLPESRPDHLEAMAELALELRDSVPRLFGLELRMGLHCGPAVGGVIGEKKLTYDVWGDTINVASRLESHGVAGKIQCSRAVRDRLRYSFELEERGPISLRGRGTMDAYFLLGPRR
jgi:class 3 adenylate cyclase